MGSPVFYKHIQEVILYRKFADMPPQMIAEMCNDFQKATNLPRGSQSTFFTEVEKHIRTEMAQGRFTNFPDICRFAETIFSVNFGSNEFQKLIEQKLIEGLNQNPSLQDLTLLMKGLSNYYMKEAYLEDLICQIIVEQADTFSVSQLEMLMWSVSKRINDKCHYPEKMMKASDAIM